MPRNMLHRLSTYMERSKRTSPSAAKVFEAYELLEMLLLNLPLKDLYVVQRVCTTWRDLIHRSQGIKKIMFLMASGPPPSRDEYFPDKYYGQAIYSGQLTLNPILHLSCGAHCGVLYRSAMTNGIPFGFATLEVSDRFGEEVTIRIEAAPKLDYFAIRDMFLTQPPVRELSYAYNSFGGREIIRSDKGITLGDLMGAYKSGRNLRGHYWIFSFRPGPGALRLCAGERTRGRNCRCENADCKRRGISIQGCRSCFYRELVSTGSDAKIVTK